MITPIEDQGSLRELGQFDLNDPRLRLTLSWEDIEISAQEQIVQTLANPFLKTLVVLPDVHWGMNVCIGTALLMQDVVIPSFVGVDIGCGMAHVNTGRMVAELDLETFESRKALFRTIQKVIPHGKGQGNKKATASPYPVVFESVSMPHGERRQVNRGAARDWGTLGHGNHFIEIGVNAKNEVGITLHSGSRSPGYRIANYYIAKSAQHNPCPAPFFAITSALGQSYYHDMLWATNFAAANRRRMLRKLLNVLALPEEMPYIEESHNHSIWNREDNTVLHRKGATPANSGELGLIPGNQLDGVYVTVGLGNERYLCSSSHGAGRIMSRTAARQQGTNAQLKELMMPVVCRTDDDVLDEAPWAYKDIHAVIKNQVENRQVDVVDYFKPIIVVKG